MLTIISLTAIPVIAFIYEIRHRRAKKVIAELKLDNWTKACCLDAVFQLNDSLIHRLKAKEQDHA